MIPITSRTATFYDGDGTLVLWVEQKGDFSHITRTIRLGNFEAVFISGNVNDGIIPNPQPASKNGTDTYSTTMAYPTVVGGYLIWKCYYGGLAMRVQSSNTQEQKVGYLLTDHLGSIYKVVSQSDGGRKLENRYSVWGITTNIFSDPLFSTDKTYTGQDASANSGLIFYQSRWYDPSIMRWIQPDTVIPDIYNPLDLDRFAYVRNNPVNHNDPSGHCLDVVECYLAFLGMGADAQGIMIASIFMNLQNDKIEVAAGIAVQSEWLAPWDIRGFPFTTSGSGLGIAQVSDKQMNTPVMDGGYGLSGLDQMDPRIAIMAMDVRISLVQNACTGCSPRDKLIAAALAQNGSGFDAKSMADAKRNKDGTIDWKTVFSSYKNPPSDKVAQLRQKLTGLQYDTQFMLLLNTRDLRAMYEKGWKLPDGISQTDLDYMEKLAKGE